MGYNWILVMTSRRIDDKPLSAVIMTQSLVDMCWMFIKLWLRECVDAVRVFYQINSERLTENHVLESNI